MTGFAVATSTDNLWLGFLAELLLALCSGDCSFFKHHIKTIAGCSWFCFNIDVSRSGLFFGYPFMDYQVPCSTGF
jgi:hypothetical protein